jgi:hypothetical protein
MKTLKSNKKVNAASMPCPIVPVRMMVDGFASFIYGEMLAVRLSQK